MNKLDKALKHLQDKHDAEWCSHYGEPGYKDPEKGINLCQLEQRSEGAGRLAGEVRLRAGVVGRVCWQLTPEGERDGELSAEGWLPLAQPYPPEAVGETEESLQRRAQP
jgi:hypothetical protein